MDCKYSFKHFCRASKVYKSITATRATVYKSIAGALHYCWSTDNRGHQGQGRATRTSDDNGSYLSAVYGVLQVSTEADQRAATTHSANKLSVFKELSFILFVCICFQI